MLEKKKNPEQYFLTRSFLIEPITDCSAGPLKRILQLNLVFIVKLHRGMVWHQPSLISASEAKELSSSAKNSGWQCHHNHGYQCQTTQST